MLHRGIRRAWVVISVVASSAALAAVACGSFGGSDDGGGGGGEGGPEDDGGAETSTPRDGSVAVTDAGQADGEAGVDASFDACVTTVIRPNADTYLVNDVSHCNSNVTFGNVTPLRVQSVSPVEIALVRFPLSNAEAAMIDSNATVVASAPGAVCSSGTCMGSAFAMRSDWNEATGGSDGADYCRRTDPSIGWEAGIMNPIAAPADYDMTAAGTMTLAGGAWSSSPLSTQPLAARMSAVAGGFEVSLLFTVTSAASSLTFPQHDVDAGMTLSITKCQ